MSKEKHLPFALTNEDKVSVKEKQIEEMVKTISTCECNCLNCKVCYSWKLCEALYNAGYRKQSEWISVEDRLPEDYNKYLLFLDNGRIAIGWYHEGAMQFVEDGIVVVNIVTHWMPLPEAPKMKGGAE